MSNGVNQSEKFVAYICERSFLKLWTHPNPKGKNNKELCDCLIVCGAHIIIISVKECEYKDTGNDTGWKRWEKAAITKSVSQIWGAERWLHSVDQIVRHDGRKISLPGKTVRKYHRISVSLGGKDQVPLKWGDLGKGFIHVCDEHSVGVVLGILDTITDFADFLDASEEIVSSGIGLIFDGGGIEDLVALYLIHGRSFGVFDDSTKQPDMLILANDIWREFRKSKDYQTIQDNYKDSYLWDRLIENFADDLLNDGFFDMHSKKVTDNELALVTMALQPRNYRVALAEAFIDFFQQPELKVASRAVKGYLDTAFCFLIGKSSEAENRIRELFLRCLVIRGRLSGVKTVVGIATDLPGTSKIGYSSGIVYINLPEWTSEMEMKVSGIQADLGFFENIQ
ncbi:hypothetical protein MHK_001538 [Candidatus Magnetomorum sp. HK-1]|nr:hypothetical protein MHK_001538 [Candidatus Magnetomorum sp. HK-1]